MSDSRMKQAELRKLDVEIAKLIAETVKINEEARKISKESRWYPAVLATSLIGAGAALATVLIKFV